MKIQKTAILPLNVAKTPQNCATKNIAKIIKINLDIFVGYPKNLCEFVDFKPNNDTQRTKIRSKNIVFS